MKVPPSFVKITFDNRGEYLVPEEFADAFFNMLEAVDKVCEATYGMRIPVFLMNCGPKFILCIKEVRELLGLSLKDAKSFCDKVRAGQKQRLGYYTWNKARQIKETFAEAGATVNVDAALSLLAQQAE